MRTPHRLDGLKVPRVELIPPVDRHHDDLHFHHDHPSMPSELLPGGSGRGGISTVTGVGTRRTPPCWRGVSWTRTFPSAWPHAVAEASQPAATRTTPEALT